MSTTDSLNEIPGLDDLHDDVDDLADDYLDDEEPEGSGRAWNGPGRPSARRDDRHQDDDVDEDVVEAGAVVAMLLDRVEAADRLDRADVADLALLLGSRWAQRLARTLNGEFAHASRRNRFGRAFLHGLLSAGRPSPSTATRRRSTSVEPVSAVLLHIEVGKRLTRAERDRLARAAGRHGARVLEDEIRDAAGPRGRWTR